MGGRDVERQRQVSKKTDPNLMICTVSQINQTIDAHQWWSERRYPELNIQSVTRSDNGVTKHEYFEDINQTEKNVMYAYANPVLEPIVYITIPIHRRVLRAERAKQLTTSLYADDSLMQQGWWWWFDQCSEHQTVHMHNHHNFWTSEM